MATKPKTSTYKQIRRKKKRQAATPHPQKQPKQTVVEVAKAKEFPNKIELIELRTDQKYGRFIEHKPASASSE